MKLKILFVMFCITLSLSSAVFADEIIQADGTVIPCKIETVMDGLIEYRQNGVLYSFSRASQSPLFNDYVIVRDKLFKKNSFSKHYGRIIIKNMWNTTIFTEDRNMDIPFFRVKFTGIYKP